ncbi:MAG TPA: DUF2207 domain-containing protein, partial [Methanosarcina sp.]|nr:DUF2207 domain-containing protein [Methanosarcina sp.]
FYYERWDHFKKYLTDLSALKEYPPESIKVWDSYLVYATALGVARQVFQNMPRIVSFDQLKESRFYPVIHVYNQPAYGPGDVCPSYSEGEGGKGNDINRDDMNRDNRNRDKRGSTGGQDKISGNTGDGSLIDVGGAE